MKKVTLLKTSLVLGPIICLISCKKPDSVFPSTFSDTTAYNGTVKDSTKNKPVTDTTKNNPIIDSTSNQIIDSTGSIDPIIDTLVNNYPIIDTTKSNPTIDSTTNNQIDSTKAYFIHK